MLSWCLLSGSFGRGCRMRPRPRRCLSGFADGFQRIRLSGCFGALIRGIAHIHAVAFFPRPAVAATLGHHPGAFGRHIVIAETGWFLVGTRLSAPSLPCPRRGPRGTRYRQAFDGVRNVPPTSCALALYCVCAVWSVRLDRPRQGFRTHSAAVLRPAQAPALRPCRQYMARKRRTVRVFVVYPCRSAPWRVEHGAPDIHFFHENLPSALNLMRLGACGLADLDQVLRHRRSCTMSYRKSGSGGTRPPAEAWNIK